MIATKYEFGDKPAVALIWLLYYNHSTTDLGVTPDNYKMYHVMDCAFKTKSFLF